MILRYVIGVDWQQIIALLIVVVTVAIMLRSRIQPRRHAPIRTSPCGCGGMASATPPTIVYHARKGERPQIVVKMS